MIDRSAEPRVGVNEGPAVAPSQEAGGEAGPAPNGDAMAPSYVFALGRIEPRFPSLEVEKEFAQATGRAETAGLTDQQALRSVLSERQNRYLARQLCWVFTVRGLETYILAPRDPLDLELYVEAVRGEPRPADLDLVVGYRGTIAPPEMCNGLMVPVVVTEQIYSFDRDALVAAIPAPESMREREQERFRASAGEVFDTMVQVTDNAGDTDEHRALNYLAVRYPGIYARTAELQSRDFSLRAVDVRPSRLSGVRRIVDVVLVYANRGTDFTERYRARVDVTGVFPFLVEPLQPYFEH